MPDHRDTGRRDRVDVDSLDGDSEEARERPTPPPLNVDDPRVQRALERLWIRIEFERTERELALKAIRKDRHELARGVANMNEEAIVHYAQDEAQFAAINKELADVAEGAKGMRTEVGAAKTAGQGWWKWGLGILIPVMLAAGAAWLALDRRVTTMEGRFDAVRDKQDAAERQLDKIDARLEAIGERVGARPASTPPGP